MQKPTLNKCEVIALVATLFCLGLPARAADVYVEPSINIDDTRILATCPAVLDVFEGISPEMDWAGFQDRDLVIFKLTNEDAQMIFQNVWGVRGLHFSQDRSALLRRRSDCKAGDKYVLIGKDGGVKRRWSGQVVVDDLFETIDAMPMRQYEMRTRGRN